MIKNKKVKKVGLDIDGLLSCFSCGVLKRAAEMGLSEHFPESCEEVDSWDMSENFSKVMKDAWEEPKFWLELPKLSDAIDFTPDCYITSRHIPTDVTKEWLAKNGFPEAEVITVSHPSQKLDIIKSRKLDLFVDDYYVTVKQLRENGINCLLFEAPYQRGHADECKDLPKISSLKEIKNYI